MKREAKRTQTGAVLAATGAGFIFEISTTVDSLAGHNGAPAAVL